MKTLAINTSTFFTIIVTQLSFIKMRTLPDKKWLVFSFLGFSSLISQNYFIFYLCKNNAFFQELCDFFVEHLSSIAFLNGLVAE
jgi:hypothetical protein